jgi:hypothetical protein
MGKDASCPYKTSYLQYLYVAIRLTYRTHEGLWPRPTEVTWLIASWQPSEGSVFLMFHSSAYSGHGMCNC